MTAPTPSPAPTPQPKPAQAQAQAQAQAVQCVTSDSLLNGATELHIDHHGVIYRLKVTELGKLILTK
jgi:hemin uptake protein HemP